MIKSGLVLAVLLCVFPASAQTLHKCIGKGGAVAFRSGPCESSERLVAVRQGASDLRTSEQWQALQERQDRDRQGSRYLSHLAGTDAGRYSVSYAGQRNAKEVRCENAKVSRDRTLRAVGLRAGVDLHRRLNSMVYDACK